MRSWYLDTSSCQRAVRHTGKAARVPLCSSSTLVARYEFCGLSPMRLSSTTEASCGGGRSPPTRRDAYITRSTPHPWQPPIRGLLRLTLARFNDLTETCVIVHTISRLLRPMVTLWSFHSPPPPRFGALRLRSVAGSHMQLLEVSTAENYLAWWYPASRPPERPGTSQEE